MKNNTYFYLPNGAAQYNDFVNKNVTFILQKQLKDEKLWAKFVKVFQEKPDGEDNGWRGEYFGKMMRGACIVYRYCPDEDLYGILYKTVEDLLATQDKLGRIATYSLETEFHGWDIWTRKYVLVGCLYFYGICKDEAFKDKILSSMQAHVDYLIQKIGVGKISILETSQWHGALNSSSILEPIVELYKLTNKQQYLSFAEYILNMGGCNAGNLLELAESGEKLPYQYPIVKAYEMMSYFEGVLAYYEATGEERYLNIVKNFVKALNKSDITIIGCAGCLHEFLDNSAITQVNEFEEKAVMQETCVTVTWIRLQERLLRLTGEEEYMNAIERATYNALYGSINIYDCKQFCDDDQMYVDGLPFDSYSPLIGHARGVGIGGYKKFSDGGFYGCCACIGAAGIGLFPLIAVMQFNDGIVFNTYHNGSVQYKRPNANKLILTIESDYLVLGRVNIKLAIDRPERFILRLRAPNWSRDPQIYLNGEMQTITVQNGYYEIDREWKHDDIITLSFNPELQKIELGDKTAFVWGNIVLARDGQKEMGSIFSSFETLEENGKLVYQMIEGEGNELIRLLLKTNTGDILLTDYASCGKRWEEANAKISVWLNVK